MRKPTALETTLLVALLGTVATIISTTIASLVAVRAAERSASVELVKVAVSILTVPPDSAHRPLRAWAIDLINSYSSVKIPAAARATLEDSVSLPVVAVTADGMITGLHPGRAILQACTDDGTCSEATIVVTDSGMVSQATAEAKDAAGHVITGRKIHWTVRSAPAK